MNLINVLLILFCKVNLNKIESHEVNESCNTWKDKHVFNSTEYHFSNLSFIFIKIDSADDLNLPEKCLYTQNITVPNLKVYATKSIFFNSDFGLKSFLNFFIFKNNSNIIVLFQNPKTPKPQNPLRLTKNLNILQRL